MREYTIKLSQASHTIVSEAIALRTQHLLNSLIKLKRKRKFTAETIEKNAHRGQEALKRLKKDLQTVEETMADRERQFEETREVYAYVNRVKNEDDDIASLWAADAAAAEAEADEA